MRNDYVGWVCTPYAGVASVETSCTKCFLEDWIWTPVWPGLRDHPLKVLQGPRRRVRRKSSFSTWALKCWDRLPTPIATAPSVNSFKRQLDSPWEELFADVPWFPILLFPPPSPPPMTQPPFTLSPFMLFQPLIHCYSLSYQRWNCSLSYYLIYTWLSRPFVAHYAFKHYYHH